MEVGELSLIPMPCRECSSINSYYATIAKTKTSPAEKTFLSECLQSANWLTRSLDQRAQTILKVASEIVRQQEQFLRHGVAYLKPLNLRNVADAIGMHEFTVSRVTANKYMLTKRGVFELRYFFNAAIAATEGGEQHSSQSVRHQIKQLIDAGNTGRHSIGRYNCGFVEGARDRDCTAYRRKISRRR